MKLLLTFCLLFISILAKSQDDSPVLIVKKIVDGKVCDSCRVTRAGSLSLMDGAKQIPFLTLNEENQFLYTDSLLNQNYTTIPVTNYFLAVAEFSLDFFSFSQQQSKSDTALRINSITDLAHLQFRTELNGKFRSGWTDINRLPADPDFYLGYAELGDLSRRVNNPKTTPVQSFHAGRIALKIGDSLQVFIRENLPRGRSYNFVIQRVRSVPNSFDFIQFSATKSFEEILNTEVNKGQIIMRQPSDTLTMEAGNSAFLRFATDDQHYFFGSIHRNSGIEYTTSNHPSDWKNLGGENMEFTNGYSYIYLNNPKSGETFNVLLRYKHQRESVFTIPVKVKEIPGIAGWIYWAFSIVGLTLLFGLAYLIQKRRYKTRIAALNHKKLEVENQLQLLSGQLNPHFLFNSLNAVQGLIRQEDPEAASNYINEVATFLRIIMDSSKKEFVSLKEEIQIEERYLMLEMKRFVFSYSVINECNKTLDHIDFPPLLLQPILENCIRHGFSESILNPNIIIKISCDQHDLILNITDNGVGFDPKVNTTGHGLSLTRKRIALLNEQLPDMPISLNIVSTPGKGSSMEITLSKWLS